MNTLQNLWRKLTTPHALDENEARREYMTRVVLVMLFVVNSILLVISLVGAIIGVITPGEPAQNFLIELLLLGGWWGADRGYWRWAGYAMPLIFFALSLKVNYDFGVGTPAMLIYASVVLLTIMLQEGQIRWGVLLLCIAAYLGIGWLHVQHRLPPAPAPENSFLIFALGVSGVLIFIAVLQSFYTAQFRRALTELVEHKTTLEERVAERTTALQMSMAESERLQQEIIEAQKQAIQELSTPVIPVLDRIIVMPLIGNVDTLRARDITRALLAGITKHQAKVVILDVTGVSIMDTGIVNHLNKTMQAARLKGARTIITGISDEVAETVVDLGIDWSNIETLRDLQTGLMAALNTIGVKLSKV